MPTVFERVQEFQKHHYFRCNSKGLNIIGLLAAKKWKDQGGRMSQLDKVDSLENGQVFQVYEYPQSFTEDIDEIIRFYSRKVLTSKNKIEKPKPSEPRKRKRIAVPIYTGRK